MKHYIDGELLDMTAEDIATHAARAPTLAAVKAELSRRVDADAEKFRIRFITPGVGQQMTYQEKFAQATAVQAIGQLAANALTKDQRDAQFPTLSASVGIEADTLWDCTLLVLERYAAFATLSHSIERIRLQAKKDIANADTTTAARTIYGSIVWAT